MFSIPFISLIPINHQLVLLGTISSNIIALGYSPGTSIISTISIDQGTFKSSRLKPPSDISLKFSIV